MSAGEGFQILQWDVVNIEKRDRKKKEGHSYVNSGTVILKSIRIDQVCANVFVTVARKLLLSDMDWTKKLLITVKT